MTFRLNGLWIVTFLLALTPGCASAPQEAPPPNAFFIAAPRDAEAYRELAREQDIQLTSCAATQSCDRIHFIRALTALYENQETAAKHFQLVITQNPNSRYAASSLQWVRLLQLQAGRNGGATRELQLMQAASRLVHDLLGREIELQSVPVARDLRDPRVKPDGKPDPPSMQSLKKELKARDKRIDELTQQLEMLKHVDQEVKEKTRAPKPIN